MEHRLKYVKYAQNAKYVHPIRRMIPPFPYEPLPFHMTKVSKYAKQIQNMNPFPKENIKILKL